MEGIESIDRKRVYLNIGLMIAAEVVSMFGTSIYNFAISLYVLRMTGSGKMFAAMMLVSAVPKIIFGVFAGSVSDRYERKSILIITDLICSAAVFLLLIFSKLTLPSIFITAIVLSVAGIFYSTAQQSSIPDIVDDSNLIKINTLSQAITSLSQIMGPIAAGIIYAFVDIKLFLFINAVSFAFSAAFEMFIDFKINKSSVVIEVDDKKSKNFKDDFMEGLKFIKSSRLITILMFFSVFLTFIIVFGMTVPFPYIVNNIIKLPSSWYGTLESMVSIGIIAASLIISVLPECRKKYNQIVFGLILCGICISLISLPALYLGSKPVVFAYYIVIMTTLGFASAIVDVPIDILLQRNIPENVRGRVMGDLNVISMVSAPVAMALSGILTDAVSPFLLPLVSGILMIAVTLFMSANKVMKTM